MGEHGLGTKDSLHLLVFLATFTFAIWLALYHWNRRKLYRKLSKIPGPPGYPLIGNAIDFMGTPRDTFHTARRYLEAYPDILKFWLGPKPVIAISKPEYMETIINHPQCLAKDKLYECVTAFMGHGLFTAPYHTWKKNRKLVNPAFNQRILDSFVPVFVEQTKIFAEILQRNSGKGTFDIYPQTCLCILDITSETTMGVRIKAQTTTNYFGELLDRYSEISFNRIMNVLYQNEFIFRWSKLKKESDITSYKLRNFTQKITIEKRRDFEDKIKAVERGEIIEDKKWKTFLELLLQLSYEGAKLTNEELEDEVNTFLAASSDTTSGTTSFCLLVLGIYPKIQQIVYEEVIDVLGPDRDITHEDLPKLQYLERFIKEVLRFFPPGAYFMRSPFADIQLEEDIVLPAQTSLILCAYYTHRSPKYWKDPLKFDPDRFLPEEMAKRHPYSYVPFSNGPRNCIGWKYALMAMKCVLATVVRKIVFKSPYKTIEDVDLTLHMILKSTKGCPVSIEKRE